MRLDLGRAALFALWGAAACWAAQAPTGHPDLTGGWTRIDPTGAGNWEALDKLVPKADLVAGAEKYGGAGRRGIMTPPPGAAPHKAGEAYVVYAEAHCGTAGMPTMMGHSASLHIVQSKDETLIIPESPGTRHVYTDGRPDPPLADIQLLSRGYSTGHWEGDTFVIDTFGMHAGGGIPGGGFKRPETHLIERYKLSEDGNKLTVTFSWQDPEIYAKPQAYEYYYSKDPADSVALEEWCDASDPRQKTSIVPPEQK